MNGTSTRTKRSIMCRKVFKDLQDNGIAYEYKSIVHEAKRLKLSGASKDDHEVLIRAVRETIMKKMVVL